MFGSVYLLPGIKWSPVVAADNVTLCMEYINILTLLLAARNQENQSGGQWQRLAINLIKVIKEEILSLENKQTVK